MIMVTNKLNEMKKIFKNTAIIFYLVTLIFSGCTEVEPVVDKLEFDRVFTPMELKVIIRNKTTAEISWVLRSDAESYVVEISEDNLLFTNIVKTATVNPSEVPYSVPLEGETQYSVRVKGVSSATADSKWLATTFMTQAENILLPVAPNDIKATSATVKWPAGSDVTNFIITPGNVNRAITSSEKAAGAAIITGLTGETTYNVKLYKGAKQRGTVSFTTLIDLGGATPVYATDDLSTAIANAKEGDVLVLFPGVYSKYAGDITISKSITIKGLYPNNKPVLNIRFILSSGVTDFYIKDLNLNGTYDTGTPVILSQAITFSSGTYDVNSLKIESCTVHDYNQALVYGASAVMKLQSLLITNCVMSNIVNDGGDFIDFRSGHVANLTITNSTFNKVAAMPRDFIRMDAASGISGTGKTCTILIDRCTFWNVSNGRRILYVRFVNNASTVSNCIFAGSTGYAGYYSNQAATTAPECSKNNYFNAAAFYTSSLKLDGSSSYTTLDPGFVDAANGNFKLTNQSLIDNGIGDPRWK